MDPDPVCPERLDPVNIKPDLKPCISEAKLNIFAILAKNNQFGELRNLIYETKPG